MKTVFAILLLCSVAFMGCNQHKAPEACSVNVSSVEFSADGGATWTTLPPQLWRLRYDGRTKHCIIEAQAGAKPEASALPATEKTKTPIGEASR